MRQNRARTHDDRFSNPRKRIEQQLMLLDNHSRDINHAARIDCPDRRPLRIMTCIHSFGPGGVERVALRLNCAWRAMGAEVRVIVGRGGGAAGVAGTEDSLCHIIPRGERITRRTQLGWMLRWLPAIIRRERPDILFCPGNTYSSVAVGMKIALGAACPPIICKISNDLTRADMGPLLRLGYYRWLAIQGRYIDQFVAMAPAMVDEIAERTRTDPLRIATVNDPILQEAELNRLAALTRAPGDGRRFIAIGRLMPQKNFSLLLRAFARIASPQDRLTILGEGPERQMLEELSAAIGVAGQVAMPGHVDNLEPWLAQADVMVMSSDYEGVPAVLIEAIAARLPVVTTRCSASMDDLLANGLFGTLVTVGDEASLARAMQHSPAPPAPAAAHAHARQFTVEQGAADYLALMATMVAAHTSPDMR